MKSQLVIAVLSLMPLLANAQIFKCALPDGSVSFSQVPCPSDSGGESQYLGEVQRSTQAEASADVVDKNLRAAEIMRGNRASNTGTGSKVTVVKDSNRSLTLDEIARERMERRRINAENGIAEQNPKRVLTNCHTVGKITNCYGTDGSRSSTTRFGNSSSTMHSQ